MKKHSIIATSSGNILEWFDIGLFIYLAPIIGQQFFPTDNALHSTLIAFGVFAAGFICRPLGGIFFGHLGDRIGRANTLMLSILMISAATLLIGFLPNYHWIGLTAPILFTAFRLLQGLSVGGEYSGVMIYLAESAPNHQRGFFTSFAAVGANAGFLLAAITALALHTLCSELTVQSWAWRLPFILNGFLGILIFYHRFNLVETPAYLHLKNDRGVKKIPLLTAFREAPGRLFRILGLTCMGSVFYYLFFGYMPNYLSQYFHVSLVFSLICQSIFLLAMLALVPLCGKMGDYFGRKKMLIIVAFAIILFSFPCLYWVQQKTPMLIFMGLGLAALISSLEQGNSLITVVENCPLDFRYSGVSFTYNLGNTIFGGTAPLVVGLLTSKIGNLAPAYYLITMALVSLTAVLSLKETYKTHLYEISEPVIS